MTEVDPTFRALLGTLVGVIVGGVLYGLARAILPENLAAGAALVGIMAGLGAKAGRAIGSHGQLRVIIFGSLVVTVVAEYMVFAQQAALAGADTFVGHLLAEPWWLVQTVLFLVFGIFMGVRLLVGVDPIGDVLEHGAGAVPPGAHGTPCPRCGSVQTALDPTSLQLDCNACAHRWRPGDAGSSPPRPAT